MNFIVFAVFFVTASCAFADTEEPEIVHIFPKPRFYNEHIREFHECVACHESDMPRVDLVSCLSQLSASTLKIAQSCCRNTYSNEVCDRAESMKLDFNMVCKDPKKALEVERCLWKKVDKDSQEVSVFRACKRQIVQNYCTSRSQSEE